MGPISTLGPETPASLRREPVWVQMGALGVGGPSPPPASSALSARSPQTAPQNRRGSSKKARCKAAPTTSDISTIGRCQCTEKNQSGLRQGGSPEDAVHPHSLGPGALACAFALTPAGCGGESGSAPRRSLPQCLGVPARAARLQQRLGEAPGSSPSPPTRCRARFVLGFRPGSPDLHSPAGTLALPRGVVGVVGAGAQQAGKGRAPPSRPRQRPPPTLTGTLLLTCWCRRPLPPPSEAPAEAAAPGSVRTRRGGRWRSGQRDKS